MTTERENAIRLVEESVAGENAQDYDRMYSVYSTEMAIRLNGAAFYTGPVSAIREAERQSAPTTYGNHRRTVEWIDATDNRVVFQYKIQFDHNGEVLGFPPTGNRVEFHGVAVVEHDGQQLHCTRLFTDQGEMNRQLSGQTRTPGTASAAPLGTPIPEGERARYEAVGERFIRTVYEAANRRDVEAELACYADPLLDHYAGRQFPVSHAAARAGQPAFYAANPKLQRDVEEVINLGDRSVLRWHLTSEDSDGQPISQHGCSVIEHDGERIQRFWAYYPDLMRLMPAVLRTP